MSRSPRFKSGFTITEILMGAALLGITVMAVSQLFVDTKRATKVIGGKDEATFLSSSLQGYFTSQSTCSNELLNRPLPMAGTKTEIALTKYQGYGWSPGQNLAAGSKISEHLRVDHITLTEIANGTPTRVKLGGVDYDLRTASIEWIFAVEGDRSSPWNSLAPLTVQVPVYSRVSDRGIGSCKIATSMAEACDLVGGKVNATNDGCTQTDNCLIMGSYQDVMCAPAGYGCNFSLVGIPVYPAITAPAQPSPDFFKDNPDPKTKFYFGNPANGYALGCPAGATPRAISTNSASDVLDCGKKCALVVNTTSTRYLCMKCN